MTDSSIDLNAAKCITEEISNFSNALRTISLSQISPSIRFILHLLCALIDLLLLFYYYENCQ